MNLTILFEDNHLLALHKPHGLLTQPSGTDSPNLESFAKEYIKRTYEKKGNVFLHAIHRLDKPVAGVVLFAKTSKALSRLNRSLKEKQVKKEYLAVVEGSVTTHNALLENHLLHADHKALITTSDINGAKFCRLYYRVLSTDENTNTTQLAITLETGRYHQIRAQLAHIGHPIIGDTKYGANNRKELGIALIHKRLTFEHPISKEKLSIESKSL